MRNPDTLALHDSRRYALVVFAGCMVFASIGIWMVAANENPFMGWANVLFFGLGSLLFVRPALDPRPRLVLDEHGLTDRHLGVGRIAWQEIRSVRLLYQYGAALLALELEEPQRILQRTWRGRRILQVLNRNLGFGDVCVSLTGLDIQPQEALDLLARRLSPDRIGPTEHIGVDSL